jgi:hypothetical protein
VGSCMIGEPQYRGLSLDCQGEGGGGGWTVQAEAAQGAGLALHCAEEEAGCRSRMGGVKSRSSE